MASAMVTMGLLMPEQFIEGGLIRLTREKVRGITHLGGTIIGTTNRGNPLKYPIQGPDDTVIEIDRSDELIRAFKLHQIDALISVGGDGSMVDCQRAGKERAVGGGGTQDDRQ